MGRLTPDQLETIKSYLERGRMSLDPLRDELLDHIIMDVERRMQDGECFKNAWQAIKEEMPVNQFKLIEKETMEITNQKTGPIRIMGFVSLALLVLATLFKMFHLPGGGILLLAFLGCTTVSLVIGYVTSMNYHRNSQGRLIVAYTAFSLFTFLSFLIFNVLHLPGARMLKYFSTLSIALVFPLLSLYFYRLRGALKSHLLIKLIEFNDRFIGNLVLILIAFSVAINYEILLSEKQYLPGVMLIICTILLASLRAYSWSWQYFVKEVTNPNYKLSLLIASSIALVCLMLPVLGNDLGLTMRQLMVFSTLLIFSMISVVYYKKISTYKYKKSLVPLSMLLLFFPAIKLGIHLGWFEGFLSQMMYNPILKVGYVIFLGILLISFRKERMFVTLVLLSILAFMIRMY